MKKIIFSYIAALFLIPQASYTQSLNRLGYLKVHSGNFVTDVWGYVDPNNGKEYAIVGAYGQIEIIDVTDPENPKQAAAVNTVPGFDIKAWKNYLYCVTGGAGINQGKILDLTDISDPAAAGTFNSAHNIFISDDGYLFAESPGLTIYNLNNNPENPEFVWSDGSGGGHDAAVIENRIYDFHGDATNIYEFTYGSSFSTQLLGLINSPEIAYHHSGWVTEDGKYLFICDELAIHPRADITVWDITNPDEAVKVDQYADPTATVHNLYIIGNYAYVSYYTSGFRIFDISDPHNIKVAAHYDTSPESGEGFNGAFGVYPFLPSRNILVSDQTGLYIFSFDSVTVDNRDEPSSKVENYKLFQNYPNPFNPSTRMQYSIGSRQFVSLKIYDVLGNEIATLVNEEQSEGGYEIVFEAAALPSGVYFYKLNAGSFLETKKMILLR
jgi:choice-of-anchor B domain-containing protein